MDEQLRQVCISADQGNGRGVLDGRDISREVSGYQLGRQAGQRPVLVLTTNRSR
ncbi:hypothetical protein [Streptomyces sp. NPDC047869]|uniref:hypothetical protein n=1 Tax=Streptomyces sp. NPDC047869 TaxID=3154709 RepID=UPI003453186F